MTESDNNKTQTRKGNCRAFFKRRIIEFPSAASHLIFWPIVFVGLVSDLFTKHLAFERIEPGRYITIIEGFLRFVRVLNDGAAFGSLAGKTNYLIAVSAAAAVMVLGIFLFGSIKHKIVVVAFGLFMAGILGNLYDRLFNNGMVRDFIDVVYWPGKHWPAFNIADSMLCIGVGLMIIAAYLTEKPCQKRGQPQK